MSCHWLTDMQWQHAVFSRLVARTSCIFRSLLRKYKHSNHLLIACDVALQHDVLISLILLHLAIIEKNVRNGINGYFKPLAEVLAQESDKVASNVDQPRKKKRYTKHRALSNQRLTSRTSNGAVHGTKSTVSNEQSTEVCSWFALVGFGFYLN